MSRTAARIQAILGDPRIIRAIVLFISAGVLLYLGAIFWFGWRATVTAMTTLGLKTLLIGAVLASTAYFWRFGRWEHSLRCFGHALPRWPHLAIYLSGLGLTATPGKSGETLRSALLLQQGVRAPHSLAAFLIDRATDVLGMCLLGFFAAWMVGHARTWVWLLAFIGLMSGSRIFAALLLRQGSAGWWSRPGRMWQVLPLKGAQAILQSWASAWKLPRVAVFSLIAVLAYGTQALVFAWFCHMAGTGLSPAACVLIFVQATLFGAASMLPAGLGAMEAALVIQMSERGVGDGVALSLAISIRLVTLWLGMAIGAVSLLLYSTRKPAK